MNHHYFMKIAEAVASRSSCIRRKVGSVLVRDDVIVSTGYNGTAKGDVNCDEGGCRRCRSEAASGKALNECVCLHAEENAVLQAAAVGTSTQDTVIYSLFSPCERCVRALKNAGVRSAVFEAKYSDLTTATETAKRLGFNLYIINSAGQLQIV